MPGSRDSSSHFSQPWLSRSETWMPPTMRNVFGVAPDDVHAIGDAGRIVYWDGASFSEPNLGSGYDLTAGWGVSKTDQWITAVVHGTPNGIFFHKGTAAMGRWIQASANT